jgi:hypothetical protein
MKSQTQPTYSRVGSDMFLTSLACVCYIVVYAVQCVQLRLVQRLRERHRCHLIAAQWRSHLWDSNSHHFRTYISDRTKQNEKVYNCSVPVLHTFPSQRQYQCLQTRINRGRASLISLIWINVWITLINVVTTLSIRYNPMCLHCSGHARSLASCMRCVFRPGA